MNKGNRICILQGHETYQVYHICTFLECILTSRWCCAECLSKYIHHHNQQNYSHIMNQDEIKNKFIHDFEKIKKEYLDKYKISQKTFLEKILKECQLIQKSIIDYMKYIENQIQNIISEEDTALFQQYLNHLDDNNFQQLDENKINQILNINKYQFNQKRKEQLLLPLDSIYYQLNQIQSMLKNYQDVSLANQAKFKDVKAMKFIVQEIDKSTSKFYGSSISENEKYLAYGYDNKLLKIYDINQKKIIKEIQQSSYFYVCQFTQDSSLLLVGLNDGNVNGYNVHEDFKEVFKQKIHQSHIGNLITIQNQYLITSSSDKTIIKTDIKNKQQVFQLIGHTQYIIAFDYNNKDDIIVSGSWDKSMKLWNCKDQSIIINKEQSHQSEVRQIQFINDYSNILSSDLDGNQINKNLIQFKRINDQDRIYNFFNVNQNQNLLLLCDSHIKILNQQGEVQNKIDHGGKHYNCYFDCRQLDNMKFIQIRLEGKLMLASSQD